MTPDKILSICNQKLEGVVEKAAWGERSIFYNPKKVLARGVYVATVKEKDGKNDKGSALDREGVFRVNAGVSKSTFEELFGSLPKRPSAGEIVDMPIDFTEKNKILPHPVYAWMGWICVLNPDEKVFEIFWKYIEEAHKIAEKKFLLRTKPKKQKKK